MIKSAPPVKGRGGCKNQNFYSIIENLVLPLSELQALPSGL